jgi:hypothetical protein
LMFLKFSMATASVVPNSRSSSVRMGRWSVLIPLSSGFVSQEISRLVEWSERNT